MQNFLPATSGKTVSQWSNIKNSPLCVEYWLELLSIYTKAGLRFPAIYVARRVSHIDQNLKRQIDATGLINWDSDQAENEILTQGVGGESERLQDQLISWLSENPEDWFCWTYLAGLYELRGTHHESEAGALEKACSLEYLEGETMHLVGLWCLKFGKAHRAVELFSALLQLRPLRHGSMMHLGVALMGIGNVVAAQKAFARASLSSNPRFLTLLATKVCAHNYWQEAIEVLKKAAQISPNDLSVSLQLAQIQSDTYSLSECQKTLQRVLEQDPENATAKKIKAGLFGKMGDAASHLKQLEKAYAEEGGGPQSRLISSIAMTLLYQDDLSAQEIADRHRELCNKVGEGFKDVNHLATNFDRKRPLRVGYVTGDLHRQHPVCIFMLPLLMELKESDIQTYIYHTGSMYDQYTGQIKSCVHQWVSAAEYDDWSLHEVILKDEIDILIDLAGHTSTHRLGVFAMRSAPIQMTYLGYPHSTGLSQMDFLIGDDVVSPESNQSQFSESLLNLPNCVFCWSPVDEYPLPPPRKGGAPVIFGSFNNIMKLSPKTIALWSKVLHAVPMAHLLLKAPSLSDSAVVERIRTLFLEHGIEGGRIECRGPSELSVMMAEYGDIDISLDPIQYNGGTTSLQALWMGVPLVTMKGKNFSSLMGASFLNTIGKSEWIADTEDEFIEICTRLAADILTLRHERNKLREKMQQSPLCNIKDFSRDYEALLLRAWRQCGTK